MDVLKIKELKHTTVERFEELPDGCYFCFFNKFKHRPQSWIFQKLNNNIYTNISLSLAHETEIISFFSNDPVYAFIEINIDEFYSKIIEIEIHKTVGLQLELC